MNGKVDQIDVTAVVELALVVDKTFGTAFGKGTTVAPQIIPPGVIVVVDGLFDDKVGREHLGVVSGSWEGFVRVEVFPLGDQLAS